MTNNKLHAVFDEILDILMMIIKLTGAIFTIGVVLAIIVSLNTGIPTW